MHLHLLQILLPSRESMPVRCSLANRRLRPAPQSVIHYDGRAYNYSSRDDDHSSGNYDYYYPSGDYHHPAGELSHLYHHRTRVVLLRPSPDFVLDDHARTWYVRAFDMTGDCMADHTHPQELP